MSYSDGLLTGLAVGVFGAIALLILQAVWRTAGGFARIARPLTKCWQNWQAERVLFQHWRKTPDAARRDRHIMGLKHTIGNRHWLAGIDDNQWAIVCEILRELEFEEARRA